ncbi:ABC transporter substrate-binding protein [Phytoactinopolyspora mesophila]|uniref:Extracellular solute-binding protein n=1 Tax=Phytoactinopolyspora mesophila TaxID=2650750 RepID=A0A7K3M0D6_9ACTN|nr:ABC transporter substrate-binding protein [Phytoactinopolyspora mesophila]NDL55918.1 extracellular solute-binding protein [Phytoactinopolyspora mesophila]
MRLPYSGRGRNIALIAATTLIAAGCAGNGVDDPEAVEAVDLDEIDEAVAIEFYYGLGGYLGEVVEEFIDRFNESQDNVVVTGVTQGSYEETGQALQAAVAAGDPPAVALNAPAGFAERGLLAALDPYIEADPDVDLDDFVDAFVEPGIFDEQLYELPMFGTTQVMYYRHDFFDDAGIDPAEALSTWENLAEAAEQLTERDNGNVTRYGWEPMYGEANMIDAVLSRGGQIISDDGTEVLIDDDVWVETWDAFREWIHEDEIMRIHHGGTGWEYWYRTIDDVLQDRAAGYTGSSGDQGDLDFDLVSAHIQPGWEGSDPAPVAGGNSGAILADASDEEKAAAWEWLKFFTLTENTAEYSIKTGYIPVRESAAEDPDFQAHAEENPHAMVPLEQVLIASPAFVDPTGGEINDALTIAADRVQIENVPAAQALAEAAQEAQEALDRLG